MGGDFGAQGGKGGWRGNRPVMTMGHGRVKTEWGRGKGEMSDAHRRMPERNPLLCSLKHCTLWRFGFCSDGCPNSPWPNHKYACDSTPKRIRSQTTTYHHVLIHYRDPFLAYLLSRTNHRPLQCTYRFKGRGAFQRISRDWEWRLVRIWTVT